MLKRDVLIERTATIVRQFALDLKKTGIDQVHLESARRSSKVSGNYSKNTLARDLIITSHPESDKVRFDLIFNLIF